MKERPILFTGPSIPMVMDGTKTQTRRIADLERLSVDVPDTVRGDFPELSRVAKRGRHRVRLNSQGAVLAIEGLKPGEFHFRCPLVDGTTSLVDLGNGKKIWTVTPVGEQRLWVRETWQAIHQSIDPETGYADDISAAPRIPKDSQDGWWTPAYAADPVWPNETTEDRGFAWRPGIHMPRWASRTTLIPIQARLMRLQDITDEDAIAEGVTFTDYGKGEHGQRLPGWHYGPSARHDECLDRPRFAFGNAWNRIHGGPRWNLKPGLSPWDLNVWVWAYTFRKEA